MYRQADFALVNCDIHIPRINLKLQMVSRRSGRAVKDRQQGYNKSEGTPHQNQGRGWRAMMPNWENEYLVLRGTCLIGAIPYRRPVMPFVDR